MLVRALRRHLYTATTPALDYVGCMLLCRLAVSESAANEAPGAFAIYPELDAVAAVL